MTGSKILATALVAVVTIGSSSAAMAASASHVEGDRATTALNLLEDNGYGVPLAKTPDRLAGFAQFQTDGRDFATYIVRHGVAERLKIDPENGKVMRS